MRTRFFSILLTASCLTGCELVATFDRDKIPPPELMRPDASFQRPNEDLDAGLDAAVSDGAIEDGAVDGAIEDGAVDGGPLDAAADAN